MADGVKKRKYGVTGQLLMLITPFILYGTAICLICVFVFSTYIEPSTLWHALMSGSESDELTYEDVDFEFFTPNKKTENGEDGAKVYYDAAEFPYYPWASQWGTITVECLGTKDVPIYNGDTADVLDLGLGHFFFSTFPGQGGNCVISFHVNRNKANGLYNLEDIPLGELITINASYGKYVYKVTSKDVFEADDTSYILRSGSDMLTVYTCYPKQGPYRTKRIAITAELQEDLSDPVWR